MSSNPQQVKYPPESLIVADSKPTVGTTDTILANFLVDPFYVQMQNLHLDTDKVDVKVGTDGHAEKVKIRSGTGLITDSNGFPLKLVANRVVDIRAIGSVPVSNYGYQFNLTTRRPYIIDKILLGLDLTAEEEDLATNLLGDKSNPVDLYDRINIGALPNVNCFNYNDVLSPSIYDSFDGIYSLVREVTPGSNSTKISGSPNVIGHYLTPPYLSEVWVLLGIWYNNSSGALTTPNDTYITVDRDDDPDYMKLDVTALPENTLIPCFVPFISELRVFLESVTGSGGNSIGVGFVYGTRPMTILDHELWDIPYQSQLERNEAQKVIERYSLKAMCKAGAIL